MLRLAGGGFLLSLAPGAAAGYAFHAAGWVRSPLLLAVALSATSLGLVVPIRKDAGQLDLDLGRLVVAGASVADFGAIVLLSFLFSGSTSSTSTRLVLLGGLSGCHPARLLRFGTGCSEPRHQGGRTAETSHR